jgi:hypothetical protein
MRTLILRPFGGSGQLDVSLLLNDPIMVATSCSFRRFKTQSGVSVCEPCTHPTDNYPDLMATDEVLQLMAASPELYESTRMLMDAVNALSSGKPIRNLDEIMLFAKAATEKAEAKI